LAHIPKNHYHSRLQPSTSLFFSFSPSALPFTVHIHLLRKTPFGRPTQTVMASSEAPSTESGHGLSLITTDLLIVSIIFPILSAIAIVLRFKARRVSRAGLRADDWWILATWILTFSISINVWIFADIIGVNHYKDDLLTGNKNSALCLVVSSLLTQSDLTTVKIAILVFYQRIFPVRRFKIAVWLAIAAVSVWGITVFFVRYPLSNNSLRLARLSTSLHMAYLDHLPTNTGHSLSGRPPRVYRTRQARVQP
jgi:hypothetical protein